MKDLSYFQIWCQKVLPLVYDDSLSYYEVLCKTTEYINSIIDNQAEMSDEINALKEELQTVQSWIDNFDTTVIEQIVRDYLATMIFVEISMSGYIVYIIPQTWADITFNTTGLDINLELMPEYGHLVLSY